MQKTKKNKIEGRCRSIELAKKQKEKHTDLEII